MNRALVISLLIAAAPAAHAGAPPDPAISTYALVVGSNSGGPGQVELHYAEDDARKVAAVLTELGGYAPDTVDVVVHPTPDVLRDRLAKLSVRVKADADAGRQSRVFFYYSGHARAEAIDLGADELPLAELRQRLFAVPATLTIVVLDACQSGAFSRVRGAAPAADFSFNSRQHLDSAGLAVLASSSGAELSQESDQLRSGYFTHNLLVGMRGAGDLNGDGQVSIDEAYRYAYHQTLLATAETAVGGQHVSLEVDLKGHGEVPLSFPRAATAAIVLPAEMEGQTLVEDRKARAVIAETYKAKGAAVRIAIAPGEYDVLVRHGDRLDRCPVALGPDGAATVDLSRCAREAIVATHTKGPYHHRLRLTLAGNIGGERGDAYTHTLDDFGFKASQTVSAGMSIAGLYEWYPKIWVGGLLGLATSPSYDRSAAGVSDLTFDWSTTTLAGLARVEQPLAPQGFGSHFAGYAETAIGLGIARTHFLDENGMITTQSFFGPSVTLGAGLHVFGRHIGASAGYEFDYAPIIDNLTGDTHASGGHRLTAAVSYTY
jgi:hypothetical protein